MLGLAIRLDCVESCYVPESVDLSLQAKEDHRPVAAALNIEALAQSSSCSQLPKRQQPACRINKYNLNDPVRRGRFEEELWKYRSPWHVPLEDHLDHWNKYLTRIAVKHFGKPQDRPRKPWISPSSWTIVKWFAPLRRAMCKVSTIEHGSLHLLAWLAWRSLKSNVFIPGTVH